MDSITLHEQTATLFAGVAKSIELRDDSGKLLGIFRPATKAEQIANAAGLHTTRQVFEHLRTLTNDPAALADLDRHIQEIARRDEDACAAQ